MKHLIPRATSVILFVVVLLVATAAYASTMSLDPIAQGERAEKLGIIGILVAIIIVLGVALWCLVRYQLMKLLVLIEHGTKAAVEQAKSNEKVVEYIERILRVVDHCAERRGK